METRQKVDELKALVKRRNLEADPAKRHATSLEICRLKRAVKRTKADELCTAAVEKLSLPYNYTQSKSGSIFGFEDVFTGELFNIRPH